MARSTRKPRAGCPTCGRPRSNDYAPFCSRRCREIDLGRWLREEYRVPAVEQDDSLTDGDGDGGEG